MIIYEQYCDYDICSLLKSKGFKDTIYAYRTEEEKTIINISNYSSNWNDKDLHENLLSCPTHQYTRAWLRNKGININIVYTVLSDVLDVEVVYSYEVTIIKDGRSIHISNCSSYENAEHAAIEHVLKYLL